MVKIESVNKRIQEIRKALDLTQEKFGKRIGVTKVAISNIENENRRVSRQMAMSICREYRVNEFWLKTGSGKMFLAEEENQIKEDMERLSTIESYLKSLGFLIDCNVTKWHYDNPSESDPSEKIQTVDEIEYVLTKDGRTVTFTSEEFEELKDRVRETIEGIFYKKYVTKSK